MDNSAPACLSKQNPGETSSLGEVFSNLVRLRFDGSESVSDKDKHMPGVTRKLKENLRYPFTLMAETFEFRYKFPEQPFSGTPDQKALHVLFQK